MADIKLKQLKMIGLIVKDYSKKNSIVIFDDYFFNNKNLIDKFGCNNIVKNISQKEYKTKNYFLLINL